MATGIAVGSGYIYETTFEKEFYSNLYGERGCLMSKTVAEARCSRCTHSWASTTRTTCTRPARRRPAAARWDWAPEFEKESEPEFERLCASARKGGETQRTLAFSSRPTCRKDCDQEPDATAAQKKWRVGHTVWAIRPKRQNKKGPRART